MASPQLESGFLRLSNELAEAMMRTPFNGSEWRIPMMIVRECYGQNGGQKVAPLTLRKIAAITRLDLSGVHREVSRLLRMGVLVRQGGVGQDCLYGVQKDYEAWKVNGRKLESRPTLENSPTLQLENSPTLKKKKLKKEKKQGPATDRQAPCESALSHRVREFSDMACRLFAEKYHGEKPTWQKKHFVQLANLLSIRRDLTVDEFSQRYKNFLGSPIPFHSQQGGSLAFFCSNYDAFIEPIAAANSFRGNYVNKAEQRSLANARACDEGVRMAEERDRKKTLCDR